MSKHLNDFPKGFRERLSGGFWIEKESKLHTHIPTIHIMKSLGRPSYNSTWSLKRLKNSFYYGAAAISLDNCIINEATVYTRAYKTLHIIQLHTHSPNK